MKKRLLLLALLWVLLGLAVVYAWQRYQRQAVAAEVCGDFEQGRLEEVVARSEGEVSTRPEGLRIAECRLMALFGLKRFGDATVEMEALLEREPDWLPPAVLAGALVEVRRSLGDLEGAARLLEKALGAYPRDELLLSLELVVRSQLEDESRLLEEFTRRLPQMGPAADRLRLRIAERYLLRKEPLEADQLVGESPPAGAGQDLVDYWYRVRGRAWAALGEVRKLAETSVRWVEAGGDADEALARHAVALSIYGLSDPEHRPIPMLEAAVEVGPGLEDPNLYRSSVVRLLGTYIVEGREEEAFALYEEKKEELRLDEYYDLEELQRSTDLLRLGEGLYDRAGTLRFRVPGAEAGTRLALTPDTGTPDAGAPDAGAPVDSGYRVLEVPPDGVVDVRRHLDRTPQRWVVRDAEGRTRASGAVWPQDGAVVEVPVELGAPVERGRHEVRRQAADGVRRVFTVVLDCGDWRFIRYGIERGDLPALEAFVESGYRAVLLSDPPYTASAMQALAFPGRRETLTVLGLVHLLGEEVAGLSFVGDNPVEGLTWLLPESPSLFEVVGRGEHTAVNLLFSRGNVDAGRHGERIGPNGQVGRFTDWQAVRPLSAAEAERFPQLAGVRLVEEAAADFDASLHAAAAGDIDLLVQRIASLDLMTHSNFGQATRTGQDDGRQRLFELYRYLDFRLAELDAALDADDVLVVMSDHGIETAMQHSREAFFVAVGPTVPRGRAAGEPDLRGVPRLLAGLLETETGWPETGLDELGEQMARP